MSEDNQKTDAELKCPSAPAPVLIAAANVVQNRGQLSEEEIQHQIQLFGK